MTTTEPTDTPWHPDTPPNAMTGRALFVEQRTVNPADLQPYPGNPNVGDVEAVRESLRTNGQYRTPVTRLLPNGELQVLAGHTTRLAAIAEGVDLRVDVVECDDRTARRIVLADNRTAQLARYDEDLLLAMLDAGDLDGTGWTDVDYRELLDEAGASSRSGLTDPDDAPPLPPEADTITKLGDTWLLGPHRLVCGDSTSRDVVTHALAGEPAQMVFTDPPYGIAYVGGTSAKLTLMNDDLKASELHALLLGMFARTREALAPGGAFYVCSPSGLLEQTFRQALADTGLGLRQQLVWVKDRFVLSRSDYHGRHETILYGWDDEAPPPPVPDADTDVEGAAYDDAHGTLLYGWREGARHTWRGGRKQSTVWEFPKPARSDLHPTMKPVALVTRALFNSSRATDTVLDLCGGSGSTLIAAHRASRRGRLIELDPRYCDVIARRYQAHTGVLPVLERTGLAVDFHPDGEHAHDAQSTAP